MPSTENQPETFSYVAQTFNGQPLSGTIDAPAIESAAQQLLSLQLRLLELKPVPRPARARRELGSDDFLAFNQQLAQLASAGLPVELGLRLVAEDLHAGPLAKTLREVRSDLEAGKTLPQAIEAHRDRFPPLYSRLVDAGVRSGNLPGTLLNLGRHITLMRALRAALWRAIAYPLAAFLAAMGVLFFLSFTVLAQFENIYQDFHAELPGITVFVLASGRLIRSPMFCIVAVSVFAIAVIAWQIARATGHRQRLLEGLSLRLPLIGPVVRRSLISRWCDAARVGIEAGFDLPGAIALAGDVVASGALRADSQRLIDQLNLGQKLSSVRRGKLIPVTVVAAMELGIERHNLPETLGSLSDLYQTQAELRVTSVRAWLTPLLLLMVGALIAVIILAMFAPMITLIQSISGGPPKPPGH